MLFECFDLAAQEIVIVGDVLVLAQAIEKRRVLARRDANAVTGGVNDPLGFDRGIGEARTSLTTNVIVDKQAGTLALENYAGAPAILQKVRKTS